MLYETLAELEDINSCPWNKAVIESGPVSSVDESSYLKKPSVSESHGFQLAAFLIENEDLEGPNFLQVLDSILPWKTASSPKVMTAGPDRESEVRWWATIRLDVIEGSKGCSPAKLIDTRCSPASLIV